MAWTVRAACDKCVHPVVIEGKFATLWRPGDEGAAIDTLRARMREHEANEHGGKS